MGEIKTNDRIEKRGLGFNGRVVKRDEHGWLTIEWDDGIAPKIRPRMCHEKELALASDQPTSS